LEPVSVDVLFLVTILDLDTEGPIKGSIYCWQSWLAQQMEHPVGARTLSPAIRMFVDGVFLPVKELAARNAFWCMPKSEVAKYCAYGACILTRMPAPTRLCTKRLWSV
jgi:hypothetical protein